jgi:hypothetical protein
MVLCFEAGRFEDAERARRTLLATTTADALTRYSFLAHLGDPATWALPLRALLLVWKDVDAMLRTDRHLRRTVGRAFFNRLLRGHEPHVLSDTDPAVLPDLCRSLQHRGMPAADAQALCRELLRDALLKGRTLKSHDFVEDPPACQLLSEDLTPEWLACLGAIRGLWRVPPPGEGDLVFPVQPEQSPPTTVAGAALDFWHCLQVATSPGHRRWRPEARRRMKQLNSELHALLLGTTPHDTP